MSWCILLQCVTWSQSKYNIIQTQVQCIQSPNRLWIYKSDFWKSEFTCLQIGKDDCRNPIPVLRSFHAAMLIQLYLDGGLKGKNWV